MAFVRTIPLVAVAAVTAALLAASTACSGDDDDAPLLPTATATTPSPSERTASPSATPRPTSFFDFAKATRTASGLAYIDEKAGSGEAPRIEQQVTVNYTGRLASNGQVFDSTQGKAPATFALTRVIKGFAEGILTMRPGGKRTVYIPAALAYGASPPPGSGIPANADLIFEIELLAVK
jgi:peptidylprolyl isomerase